MRSAIFLLSFACVALAATIEQEALQEYKNGNRIFTEAFYKEVIKVKTENIAVCPFSARLIMALTNEGARGESSSEIVTGVSLPGTNEKIRMAYQYFLPAMTPSDSSMKLVTANKVFIDKTVKLENEFKQVAVDTFKSGVEDIDFSKSSTAAEKINAWVEGRTENRIKNLVDPTSISKNTKIMLVNSLYFKGRWMYPFYERSTTKEDFHTSKDTTVEVQMMRLSKTLRYYENPTLKAKYLELFFYGNEISMVFILPDEIEGLPALEKNMKAVLAQQPFKEEHITVQIPKFKIETHTQMIPLMQKMGINKIFNEQEADLHGISSQTPNLSVSEVVQKVFLVVNEAGIETTTATEEIDTQHGPSESPKSSKFFTANHPFMYFIQCKGVILFVGRYQQ